MITEAIILAGGLGTRLRSVVPDLPKCMAEVAGKPFLYHVTKYYRQQGINKFIFSLGYKHEVIEDYLRKAFSDLTYTVSIESDPLGTGGAIYLACSKATSENVLVLNGDTLFEINLQSLSDFHDSKNAACTLALKKMHNTDRYGVVETDDQGRIVSFSEKRFYETSVINGGVYALNVTLFQGDKFPEKFSFEKDYLEMYHGKREIYGLIQDGYFIDIGIPEDFARAQEDLKKDEMLDLKKINSDWSLFLDRDGVINHDKSPYTLNAGEFEFYDGVLEAIKKFSSIFKHILVVTNQRGVGKKLMTENDLLEIHELMTTSVSKSGGRIDKIYYCTAIENDHPDRKPNPGMALRAMKDHPAVNKHHSIMVGNNMSDMQFGKAVGMYTVLLTTTGVRVSLPHPLVDLQYDSLIEFANALPEATDSF